MVRPGEVLGLVGENGAGKSTLIKILSGAYQRDAGTVTLAGEPVEAATPNAMLERGVAVIYQEPALAPHLSVAENVFMGRLPTSRIGVVDWARLRQDTAVVAQRLGLDLNPRTPVGTLSVARRQMVEIAKALSRDARVIVLDEPSAVLGDAELRGPVRRDPPARRTWRCLHLHLAPAQRGVRDHRPGHGHEGRPGGRRRADPRPDPRTAGPADGRAGHRRHLPARSGTAPGARRSSCAAFAATASSTTST